MSLSSERFEALRSEGVTWVCTDCRGAGSPARPSTVASVSPGPSTLVSGGGVDLMAAITSIGDELRNMRMQQSELIVSVNFCSNKISEFEAQLLEIKKNSSKIDGIVAENKRLKDELSHVKERLNSLDQMSRMNNVEIVGVPEVPNENLIQIFEKITEHVDYKLSTGDIDHIHRVPKNKNSTGQMKKIIIVKFKTK